MTEAITTSCGRFKAEVLTSIDAVGPEWDELMATARAPVFYRRPFLSAFERYPLHPVRRTAYILIRDAGGVLQAAFPAYLQQGVDPMRVINDHFPETLGQPALMSHVWHCYDTVIPARPRAIPAINVALDMLHHVACDWGATLYGLANVDAATRLNDLLEIRGLHGTDIDIGWGLDLPSRKDYDGYLTTLPSKPRRNLQRDLRAAQRAGVTAIICAAHDADLDGFVTLARATAAKHNNSDYYQPGLFQNFVLALGDDVRVLELRARDGLICSGLILLDDTRYHFWACGFAPRGAFSAFYVAFDHIMRGAFSSGRSWVELGRRNPDFKRRYGLTPRTLRAWAGTVHDEKRPPVSFS
ncbi:GNAT family N-acetyltransferase [Streptomyces sp. NPDC007205]|uniref:GNAT family N-acetyltransferase n=1 Tax=Streptomyces sp. NPDC007205 TaxID=3154316 RepID=UPI0033E87280